MKIINGDIYQKEYKQNKKYEYYKELSKNILLLIAGLILLLSDVIIGMASFIIGIIILMYVANSIMVIIKYEEDYFIAKAIKLFILSLLAIYIILDPKITIELIMIFFGISILIETILNALIYKFLNISKLIISIILIASPLFLVKIFLSLAGVILLIYSIYNLSVLHEKKK